MSSECLLNELNHAQGDSFLMTSKAGRYSELISYEVKISGFLRGFTETDGQTIKSYCSLSRNEGNIQWKKH